MAYRNRNRDKKRVRIQSGHQERIIERRTSRPRYSVRKTARRTPKRRTQKMRSAIRRSKDQPHWNCKTHRPTVAQVVYQFLERASNSGSSKSQKSNATNNFRHLQRRKHSKRLRPDVPKRIRPKVEAMDFEPNEEYRFPYSKVPSHQAEKSIEKCIYEVLSFGTILGLLEPADREGMTFRVASDIALFKNENKRDQARKRKLDLREHNCMYSKYCEC